MGKLVDLLERTTRVASTPLGFGPASKQEKNPSMVLLGSVSSAKKARQIAGSSVDALVIVAQRAEPQGLEELARALEGIPWGVQFKSPNPEETKALKEKGMHFLVFEAEGTPLEALQEDVDRVLAVPQDLEEQAAQALEDLPIDAVLLIARQEVPLQLRQLMALGALRSLINKPFMVMLNGTPSSWELECLRDIGINGIVLEVEALPPEAIAETRRRMGQMPRRKPRGEKPTPLLPRVSAARQPAQDEEEEEEKLA